MKKTLTFALLCISIFSIYSCHKDGAAGAGPEGIKPDLTVKTTCSISGYVTDESGSPVFSAEIFAGDRRTTTDEFGYFTFSNVSLPQVAGLIKATSSGFFNGYKTFIPQTNKETFLRIGLLTKKEAGTIDAVSGGEVTTAEGGKVIIPANGVVTASGGAAYTGQVHISARWLNPADASSLQLSIPGDGRGTASDGYLKALKSYGVMAVELTGAGGQLLQIAPNRSASLTIPISSGLSAAAPASIALWSFNDSTGLWKQEGSAVKNGSVYSATTSHFSFWDGAEGASLVNFKAKIVDASSHPLANVPVTIDFAGAPLNAGYGRFGYTDADGNVTGAVFANSNLVFQVLTPCAIAAYAHPFTTTAADIDLGQMTGNMGQNTVTLSGTVSNCSQQPVTDGYIQTYDHGFYNRIPINNGHFTFTGVACTNLGVNMVAIDNAAHQQGQPQTVTLTPGTNDLGALTACGASTIGSLSFTLDGVTTTITEPTVAIGGYFLEPASDTTTNRWTQIVTLTDGPDHTQQIAFQFDGGKAIGEAHHLTEVFSPKFSGGRGYWPVPITLNISEYSEIGGFISGTFSNQLIDFDNAGVHNFSCTFRVRRYK